LESFIDALTLTPDVIDLIDDSVDSKTTDNVIAKISPLLMNSLMIEAKKEFPKVRNDESYVSFAKSMSASVRLLVVTLVRDLIGLNSNHSQASVLRDGRMYSEISNKNDLFFYIRDMGINPYEIMEYLKGDKEMVLCLELLS
jgi:hypothetical protein